MTRLERIKLKIFAFPIICSRPRKVSLTQMAIADRNYQIQKGLYEELLLFKKWYGVENLGQLLFRNSPMAAILRKAKAKSKDKARSQAWKWDGTRWVKVNLK